MMKLSGNSVKYVLVQAAIIMASFLNKIQARNSPMMSRFSKFQSDPLEYFDSPEMKGKVTPEFLRCMSICGVSYSVIVTSIITLASVFITLPALCEDRQDYWQHVFVVLFLTGNIVVNFIFVTMRKSFYKEDTKRAVYGLPDVSWSKCLDCEHNIPPRTHHCPLCQRCILRRDHHCFFTGCCVGFDNQRYFLMFCLYCGLGSFYGFYYMYHYMSLAYFQTESMSFIHYLLPIAMLECIFRYMTFDLFFCIFVSYLSVVSGFGSLGIFAWQMFLAALGTTTYEYNKGDWLYKRGVMQNLRQVFGPWWALNLICPMPWFQTPGDGIDWHLSKCV